MTEFMMYLLGLVVGIAWGSLMMLARTRLYGEWPIQAAEVWKVLTAQWTFKL